LISSFFLAFSVRLNTNFLSNIASILQGKPVQRDFL